MAGVFSTVVRRVFRFQVLGFGFGLWTRRGVIGELLQELLCFDYGLLVYIDLRLAEPCQVGEPGAVGGDVFCISSGVSIFEHGFKFDNDLVYLGGVFEVFAHGF